MAFTARHFRHHRTKLVMLLWVLKFHYVSTSDNSRAEDLKQQDAQTSSPFEKSGYRGRTANISTTCGPDRSVHLQLGWAGRYSDTCLALSGGEETERIPPTALEDMEENHGDSEEIYRVDGGEVLGKRRCCIITDKWQSWFLKSFTESPGIRQCNNLDQPPSESELLRELSQGSPSILGSYFTGSDVMSEKPHKVTEWHGFVKSRGDTLDRPSPV
ncbi:hypothetical protein RRG08_052977 [Elysia crispata]|uniref:Uncharacterized protein n=1 Tax=Elysia crispata TaxID=231223 RepID=A0AAE0ZLH1_9GAST|nr:hypothetical protein RRG08_052977 [Elysia crispata]